LLGEYSKFTFAKKKPLPSSKIRRGLTSPYLFPPELRGGRN
jgi:hypothetical protein